MRRRFSRATASPTRCSGSSFASLIAAALGLATAPLLLRGADLTRLMVTMGVALMLGELANRNSLAHRRRGRPEFHRVAPVLGLFPIDFTGQRNAALYSLAVLFLLFALARRLARSPFGLSLLAIRENRLRAGALGISTSRRHHRDLYASRPPTPAPPARCSRRRRRSSRSTCSTSIAPPTSC